MPAATGASMRVGNLIFGIGVGISAGAIMGSIITVLAGGLFGACLGWTS
jgi:hypothetical protein